MPVWVAVLTAVLTRPLLTHSGYLLGHDLVFTPRQPLDAAAFGISTASPRAVPVDALVASAERLVDGAVVGRLAVVLPLLAAGAGCALLLRSAALVGRLAAAGVAVWNPYVVERLALGQWALLWAYAALPWLVLAGTRRAGPGRWAGQAAALAAASITPTGGLIAAATAVGVAVGTRRPKPAVVGTAALAALLQLPWVVPALVSGASVTSDPAGVAAFAARSEHGGGVLLTLLGGGGIWNSDVVPGSRTHLLPWLWLALLVAAAAYGTGFLARLLGARLTGVLTVLAAAGVLLALVPSLPGGGALMRVAVNHVPGAGLLRDAQKWIMPLVVFEALLVGAAAARLARRSARSWRPALAAAALAAPLLVLPDAASTVRPTLDPVHYPADWRAVAARAVGGDAVVLPWSSYRRFSWAPARVVLDPAPRLLRTATVVDDRLFVGGRPVPGEDPRARRVGAALAEGIGLPARLAGLGIRWVVVEHGTPGRLPPLRGLLPAYAGTDVSLYRVPGPVAPHRPPAARIAVVGVADGVAGAVLLALLLLPLPGRYDRFRPRPKA